MGFEPNVTIPTLLQNKTQPSKTYSLNFNTGKVGRKIDGEDAIRQFIRKAIKTARFRHPIYSDDYGCEIDDLIGKGFTGPFMEAEITRVITEAIIYDERIKRVYDFKVTPTSDKVEVVFSVETSEGVMEISEVI